MIKEVCYLENRLYKVLLNSDIMNKMFTSYERITDQKQVNDLFKGLISAKEEGIRRKEANLGSKTTSIFKDLNKSCNSRELKKFGDSLLKDLKRKKIQRNGVDGLQ